MANEQHEPDRHARENGEDEKHESGKDRRVVAEDRQPLAAGRGGDARHENECGRRRQRRLAMCAPEAVRGEDHYEHHA